MADVQDVRTTISSREFNQDTARAKRSAEHGPVFITDRGVVSHVLLSIGEYRRSQPATMTIGELLSRTPGVGDVELELPERNTDELRDPFAD